MKMISAHFPGCGGCTSARLIAAVAVLQLLACDQAPTRPDATPLELRGRAIALTVDVGAGTVRQAGPGAMEGSVSGPQYSLIGQREVVASVTNVTRTTASGHRVLIRFDLALTNQLENSDLVPSTFPAPPADEVVAFPFSTDPAALFGLRVIATGDWDGAPWNFFNDAVCVGFTPTSDCYRWEGFGPTIPAGGTTPGRTVGFHVDASVTSFTVYIVVAADIRERPPQPPPPLPFPTGTVFVSPTGTDAAGGDVDDPVRTITHAIALSVGRGADRVVVSVGVYRGSFQLANGVSVLGGYDPGFTRRDLDAYRAVLTVAPGEPVTSTVRCMSITTPTVLEGFTIMGPDLTTPGASSHAIHVSDCGEALAVQNNVIVGGRGGDGTDGSDGSDGIQSVNGQPGQAAVSYDASGAVPVRLGGSGGISRVASGGRGGDGSEPFYDQQVGSGMNGDELDRGRGSGGLGGTSGQWSSTLPNALVLPTPPLQLAGLNGEDGNGGSNGAGGPGGGAAGEIIGGTWIGGSGSFGLTGNNGAGGGGGGASGGGEDDTQNPSGPPDPFVGATGGGGGSGKEGGSGGQAGHGGGGSFAIFVHFSAPPATLPTITGNALFIGRGGRGGSGGKGGIGGIGGSGAPGGSSGGIFAAAPGGNGGNGGDGGHGGGGGGGGGGLACGIGAHLQGASAPAWAESNTIDTSSGGGGAGGKGGPSFGNPGNNGAAGDLTAVRTF